MRGGPPVSRPTDRVELALSPALNVTLPLLVSVPRLPGKTVPPDSTVILPMAPLPLRMPPLTVVAMLGIEPFTSRVPARVTAPCAERKPATVKEAPFVETAYAG